MSTFETLSLTVKEALAVANTALVTAEEAVKAARKSFEFAQKVDTEVSKFATISSGKGCDGQTFDNGNVIETEMDLKGDVVKKKKQKRRKKLYRHDNEDCFMLASSQNEPLVDEENNLSDEAKALDEKELGNAAFKEKDYAVAINHYKAAIKYNPKEINFYNNLAAAYKAIDHLDNCIKYSKEAIRIGQENNADTKFIAKAWNRMGKTHDGNGLWDEVGFQL